jgi:TonB family protein
MMRAEMTIPAAFALLLCQACGGLMETLEGEQPTALERAQEHCEPALKNTRLYEDVPPIDERAVGACVGWYGHSASEAELTALECMAGALEQATWDLCRAPFAPSEQELAAAEHGSLQVERAPIIEVKQRNREIAENAGILAALREAGELDGVFGSSSLDSDLSGGIGGLIGAKGIEIGSGGLGTRGSGLGGGGTAEGLGGLGTRGTGGGASGYGAGGGSFGRSSAGGVVSISGDPSVVGALDQKLVDAVVKRHMNQIRYCYQRELVKDPNIAGEVVVAFEIAGDGAVSSASIASSTMGHTGVESCVTGRFQRMRFPAPSDGGTVTVTYPFVFRGEEP